jgi:hypothetical protein
VALSPAKSTSTQNTLVNVRAVNNPKAMPVFLTRDRTLAGGSFIHEQVSPALFDEINNILDANRILARGQRRFFFGPSIYYQIYADRRYVTYNQDDFEVLFETAVKELYTPGLFWATKLPVPAIAKILGGIVIEPRQPAVHYLMRIAVMLGTDFSTWLFEKWKAKWHSQIQKPHFYDTFAEMRKRLTRTNPSQLASRLKKTWHTDLPGEKPASVDELLADSRRCDQLLSRICLRAFEEHASNAATRDLARGFDYLAHSEEFTSRAPALAKALVKIVGGKEILDVSSESSAEATQV